MKFYKIDDQIVISDKALSIGKELTANTTDAAQEKHVPVIEQKETGEWLKIYQDRMKERKERGEWNEPNQ